MYDLIVIGAGPSGIAGAVTAAQQGLKVALIDEQIRPGGQIYRNVGSASAPVKHLLGQDYAYGGQLVQRLQSSKVEIFSEALVWDISEDRIVSLLRADRSEEIQARHILVATGAMERPSPIPGWTLPGVMNAGAAQIALKSGPSIPEGKIILAGTGPLLLLVACQLLAAGADLTALIETAPRTNTMTAARFLPSALRSPKPLMKGLRMLITLRRSGVPWYRRATHLSVSGTDKVQALNFRHNGADIALPADVLLLHHGVVPNSQITRLLRLAHQWSDTQLCWQPIVDEWGMSDRSGIWVAGDGRGIDGARAAEASGTLTALQIARSLGRISESERETLAMPWRRTLAKERAVRPFLDALYRPPEWIGAPSDDTIVCRCEEVSAGRIRMMASMGCAGPNQTKFFSRCGMGPCQGRLCGITVTQILSAARMESPESIGAYRIRAPLKPIPLRSIASLRDKRAAPIEKGDDSE
jgi:NADPH-dependent 2,4-dienoyl-CoA reductase/sulfur reductase-like enzyme